MMAESDSVFASIAGFIQFDIEEREYNDGIIRDATIRSLASGDLCRISFFPDFEEVELERGDFIAVDAKVMERDVETDEGKRTYVNFTARRVFKGDTVGVAPATVQKKSSSASTPRKTF
jgi:hypothetical protein